MLDNINIEEYKKQFTILILRFDKGHYKKHELDEMSDIEKYKTAVWDKRNCWIYKSDEYTDMVNHMKPMEKYVWMYIIFLPTEIYEHFWDNDK